jgi:hypothetical protein
VSDRADMLNPSFRSNLYRHGMAKTPHPADDDARPFAMGLRLLFVVVALAAIVVAVVLRHGWR